MSIVEQLPSLRSVVLVPNLGADASAIGGVVPWDRLLQEPREPAFAPVPFAHPLWILYSSGTTGLPKAMVQGHGGILLEHLKSLSLHLDLGPDDRFFWFTTTGWMMWNFLVSGLLARIVDRPVRREPRAPGPRRALAARRARPASRTSGRARRSSTRR